MFTFCAIAIFTPKDKTVLSHHANINIDYAGRSFAVNIMPDFFIFNCNMIFISVEMSKPWSKLKNAELICPASYRIFNKLCEASITMFGIFVYKLLNFLH